MQKKDIPHPLPAAVYYLEPKQWPHSSYVFADDCSHMLMRRCLRHKKNQGARDATRFKPLVMVNVVSGGGRSGGGQVMTWQLS